METGPSDDPLAPVEGISLERYAVLAVELHGAAANEIDAIAEAHGIPRGRLNAIAEEWNRRMAANPEIVTRYSALYQQALRDAGVRPPDISLEQYADIMRQAGAGRPLGDVLPEFGLDLQTFAMVSQRWTDAMASDPTVAVRFATLAGMLPGQPEQPQ